MTQKCRKCLEQKPLDFFAWRSEKKGKKGTICRDCHAVLRKEHYAANRDKYIAKAVKLKQKVQAFVTEYKSSRGCCCCPEKEPICLDFHHLDPAVKDKAIAFLVRSGLSVRTLMKEIDKCVVICSNCHRKLHKGLIKLPGS